LPVYGHVTGQRQPFYIEKSFVEADDAETIASDPQVLFFSLFSSSPEDYLNIGEFLLTPKAHFHNGDVVLKPDFV
jgi:hypothetical protein